MTAVLIKRGKCHITEAETRMMQVQVSESKDGWPPPEAGKRKRRISFRFSEENHGPANSLFSDL